MLFSGEEGENRPFNARFAEHYNAFGYAEHTNNAFGVLTA